MKMMRADTVGKPLVKMADWREMSLSRQESETEMW